MRKTAFLITPENIDTISVLNGGVRPAEECLDNSTYFIYAGDSEADYSDIVSQEVFDEEYLTVVTLPANKTRIVEKI